MPFLLSFSKLNCGRYQKPTTMKRCISTLIFTIGFYGILTASQVSSSAAGTGCTISFQEVLTNNPDGCSGSEDGSICITIKGTVSDEFELSIDNGFSWTYGKGNICKEDLPSGSYTLKIKDQGGCIVTYSGNPVVLGVDNPVTINEITTSPQTNGELGTIAVNASGMSPLQYRINNGTWQTSEKFLDLVAGTYDIDVMDAMLCVVSDEATVADQRCPEFTASKMNETNCFSPNGAITITTSIGVRPLTYSNDNGSTWQSDSVFTGLSNGTYQLAVKGDNECVAYGSINVPVFYVRFSLSSSVVNVAGCMGDATGEIMASAFNGKAPRTFSIDDGSTWRSPGTFTGLIAGSYTAIVKDDFGCTDTTVFTITQPVHDTIDYIAVENIIGCAGNANGTISIDAPLLSPPIIPLKSATGSSSKYYSIDGGSTWQSSNFFNNLIAGEYTAVVKVEDCEYPYYLNPVIINEPDSVKFSTIEITGDYGTPGGEISITASGGNNVFEYSNDGGSTFSESNTFTALSFGPYDLVVSDGIGCTADSSVTVPDVSIVISEVTFTDSLICYSDFNGSITIHATGGSGTLSYSIVSGENWQTSNEFTGLNGNEYYIRVKDSNGTIKTWSGNPVIIFEPEELYFDYEITPPSCDGNNDGVIEFFDVEGGTRSYLFSIDDGATYSSEFIFDSLAPGFYNLSVKDENGCIAEDNIELRQPESLEILADAYDISCYGETDGSISFGTEGEGGEGIISGEGLLQAGIAEKYYSIDNGLTWQTSTTFENLVAGEYYAWCKNMAGCMQEYEHNPLIVEEPEKFVIDSLIIIPDDGTSNGIISFFLSGGTGIREYSINGGTATSFPVLNGLSSGDYHIVINDQNDCTIDTVITVNYDPIHISEHILNTSYADGDTTCIGAYQTITVGDYSSFPVDFNLGSSTSLIAGTSITFLPGVHIYEGAYLSATITTDSSFCEVAGGTLGSPVVAIKPIDKSEVLAPEKQGTIFGQSMKVFPNPNNGRFVVELTGFHDKVEIVLYNSLGSVIYKGTIDEKKKTINLHYVTKGLYFIKTERTTTPVIQKIIIN